MEHMITVSEQVRAQARQWQVHLHSGAATKADAQAFKQWLASNPAHRQAWAELSASVNAVLPVMQDAQPLLAGWQERARQHKLKRQYTRRAFLGGGLTAAAVGFLAWRPPLDLWPSISEYAADFRTAVGEQREFQISDSIAVHMNTHTRINQRLTGQGADLELLGGEAEIRVFPSSAQGLRIKAGSGQVLAHTAVFNVRYTGPEVTVSCLHGIVRVEPHARDLLSGQQLVYQSGQAYRIVTADVKQVSAWRTGHLSFAGTPLQEVVDEINRYRSGKILIYSDALKRRPVHLNLAINDMDQSLDVLRSMSGIRVQELAGGLALLIQA